MARLLKRAEQELERTLCPVCQDHTRQICVFERDRGGCGHRLCYTCLSGMIDFRCPLCRESIENVIPVKYKLHIARKVTKVKEEEVAREQQAIRDMLAREGQSYIIVQEQNSFKEELALQMALFASQFVTRINSVQPGRIGRRDIA